MKTITKNTLLKCGDKVYSAVESDDIIYWVDKPLDNDGCIVPKSIVALTAPKFTKLPIINLDSYTKNFIDINYSGHKNGGIGAVFVNNI